MGAKLHIVSFNVPYPADYGGVIDVFYRIKALHKLGVEVVLHTFTYGRPEAKELEGYCSEVRYYKRKTGLVSALGRRPYIVGSRDCKELMEDLRQSDGPILLEGLHCCAVLEHVEGRKIMVRAHNVEHDYYSRLADVEGNLLKRIYLRSDACKLRRYEPILRKAAAVFAVTEADAAHFREIGCGNVRLMPSSHINDDVVSLPSSDGEPDERYALYHADLSVAENIEAAMFLVDKVFRRSNCRLVVAGRNPSRQIVDAVSSIPNARLVANPDDAEMQNLIRNAHVQILVTNMATGLKLKLLNSLYAGRHCLVNSKMVAGTDLGKVCTVADDEDALLAELDRLMKTPFTVEDIVSRRNLLGTLYSNEANARILIGGL